MTEQVGCNAGGEKELAVLFPLLSSVRGVEVFEKDPINCGLGRERKRGSVLGWGKNALCIFPVELMNEAKCGEVVSHW